MKKELSKIEEEEELLNTNNSGISNDRNQQLNENLIIRPEMGGAGAADDSFQPIFINNTGAIDERDDDQNDLLEWYDNIYGPNVRDQSINTSVQRPEFEQSILIFDRALSTSRQREIEQAQIAENIQTSLINVNEIVDSINIDNNNLRNSNLRDALLQVQNIANDFNSVDEEFKKKLLKFFDPEMIQNLLKRIYDLIDFSGQHEFFNVQQFNELIELFNKTCELSKQTWIQIKILQETQESWTWTNLLLYGSIFLLISAGTFFLIRNRNAMINLNNQNIDINNNLITLNSRLNIINDQIINAQNVRNNLINNNNNVNNELIEPVNNNNNNNFLNWWRQWWRQGILCFLSGWWFRASNHFTRFLKLFFRKK